jgi:hypothetical protein
MSAPHQPPLEPVRDDGVRVIQVGLGLWVLVGLILLVVRGQLADRGTEWWLAVCGAGLLAGLVQLGIFSRRRALIRARERRVVEGPVAVDPHASDPGRAGPTG